MSIVTFGFFFSDLGTVISGGAHLLGAGLVLGLAGWLACTAGSRCWRCGSARPTRPASWTGIRWPQL